MELAAVELVDSVLDIVGGSGQKWNREENKVLAGPFAPVSAENTNMPLKLVEGSIPEDIDEGMFMRNGPNPVPEHGFKRRNHWFDGHGMFHCIKFGKAGYTYSNAYIRTKRFDFETRLGREYFIRLGELAGMTGLARVMVIKDWKNKVADMTDLINGPANTHTIMHNKRLLALNEGNVPFEIALRPDGSFESKGFVTEFFNNSRTSKSTKLRAPISAHPKVDKRTGEMMFHGYTAGKGGLFQYGVLDRSGAITSYLGVQTSGDSFAHDMLITEHHSILFDFSVRFDPVQGIKNDGAFFAFSSKHRARFGVLPRHATSNDEVVWYEMPDPGSYSLVHPLNAWEEVDPETGAVTLVLWTPLGTEFSLAADLSDDCNEFHMSCIKIRLRTGAEQAAAAVGANAGAGAGAGASAGAGEGKGRRLNIVEFLEGRVTVSVVDTSGIIQSSEFPTLHPHFVGYKSRFGYSGVMEGADANFVGLAKWDLLEERLVGVIRLAEGHIGGEPVIIPKNKNKNKRKMNADCEYAGMNSDDVYLAQFVSVPVRAADGAVVEYTTEFVLHDGASFDSTPIMRIQMPVRVPIGFHGLWVSEEELGAHITDHSHRSRL